MKYKIICILISLITAFSMASFSACSNNGTAGDKANQGGGAQSNIGENVVYSFNEALYDIKMSDGFGRVQISTQSDYVKVGTKSLKLTPIESASYPFVIFPFFSKYVNALKNNLKKLRSITFEIYANENADLGIGLYFSKEVDSKTPVQKFNVESGWNKLVYDVNLPILELYGNLDEFYGAYLSFEGESRPIVYVDSISVDEADSEIAYETLININSAGENVLITDFETTIHSNLFNAKNPSGLASPTIEVVNASEYGVADGGRQGVLRVKPVIKTGNSEAESATYLYFADAYMRAIDWNKYSANLNDYKFKFDIYTKCQDDSESFFGLYIDYGTEDNGWTVVATQKHSEWTTCSVSLNAFIDYMTNCKGLAFRYLDGVDKTREFFIDNVRIEKDTTPVQNDSFVWNSFDDGNCVLDSYDTTWYEEYCGEKGVIEFSLETLKTRQFRPKNFKSLFGIENYQDYKYLKFRVKSNTNFAFIMIYESKWRTVSFNNYKQAITDEWVDYYVDLSDILSYFDGFNSNLIIRIDADTENAKIWVADVRAVNTK